MFTDLNEISCPNCGVIEECMFDAQEDAAFPIDDMNMASIVWCTCGACGKHYKLRAIYAIVGYEAVE